MQRFLPAFHLPVRSFCAFRPARYLLALSTASTLTLTACGVSYSSAPAGRSSSTQQPETSAADLSAKERVIVDNSEAGFRLYVEPGYHQLDRATEAWSLTSGDPSVSAAESGGVGKEPLSAPTGFLEAGRNGGAEGARVAAIALWEAELAAAPTDYTVYVYIVPSVQNTQYASYCFSMGTGDEDQETQDCGLVDQSSGAIGWRPLTTLPLKGRAQVWLDPGATLESGKRVVADAVMFVPATGG